MSDFITDMVTEAAKELPDCLKNEIMKMETDTTITSYLEEQLTITLTRREVYWIRDHSKRRLNAAMQGMNALNASPAKRSARREEYEFHQNLISHLYGVEPSEEEVRALREAEMARQAMEMQTRAAKLKAQADALMEDARKLVNAEAV